MLGFGPGLVSPPETPDPALVAVAPVAPAPTMAREEEETVDEPGPRGAFGGPHPTLSLKQGGSRVLWHTPGYLGPAVQ